MVIANRPPRNILFKRLTILALTFTSPVFIVPLPVFLEALLPPVLASIITLLVTVALLSIVMSVSLATVLAASLLLSAPVVLLLAYKLPSGLSENVKKGE